MQILNIGSLNLDNVYRVSSFAKPGETVSAKNFSVSFGGKGLNQSVALAKAGAKVKHLGVIGYDGNDLKVALEEAQVDVSLIRQVDIANGNAVIQVDDAGQNCIIVNAGSNDCLTEEQIDAGLRQMQVGDMVLLQNETNKLAYALERAKQYGLKVVLNPSPINEALLAVDLQTVDLFVLNEIEAEFLTSMSNVKPEILLNSLHEKYPQSDFLLTLGERGSVYFSNGKILEQHPYEVKAVDTTAAGDTFTGYFLASIANEKDVKTAMNIASAAAAIAVSKHGAQSSIPTLNKVEKFISEFENDNLLDG